MENVIVFLETWYLWILAGTLLIACILQNKRIKSLPGSHVQLIRWLFGAVFVGIQYLIVLLFGAWALAHTFPTAAESAFRLASALPTIVVFGIMVLGMLWVTYVTGIVLPARTCARDKGLRGNRKTWETLTLLLDNDSWLSKLAWRFKI